MDYQDNAHVLLNIAKDAVFANAVTPDSPQFAFEFFAEATGILIACYAFIQITNNAGSRSLIELLELL